MNDTQTLPSPNPAAGVSPDLAAYWYLLLARKKWIIWSVAICGLIAGIYLLVTPKTYTAQCVVQVEQEKEKVVTLQTVARPEEFKTPEAVKTVEQALTGSDVLMAVANANHLFDDPDFVGKDGAKLTESQMLKILGAVIKAKLRRGSRLIDITVDDVSPERAMRLANSVVAEYSAATSRLGAAASGNANEFLTKQAEELKGKLEKAEMALQDYREKHDAVSLEDKQDTINAKLTQLNTAVTDAENTRIKLESALKAVQKSRATKGSELLEIPDLSTIPEIMDLRKDIKGKETEIANLRGRYGELHPNMIAARAELKKLQDNLNSTAEKSASLIEKSYRAAVENEANLKKALRDQEKAALELSKISVPYSALQREVEADNTMLQTVLQNMKQSQIEARFQNAEIRLQSPPLLPTKPTKPKRKLILAGALVAGFLVGAGIVIGLDLLDSSFRSVDQAENLLGLPVLGAVPQAGKKDDPIKIELIEDPSSVTSEAFRGFRTAIALTGNHGPINVVLFTSAASGEGKSYAAANYAVSLAQQGLKTLLIDADLRRPGLNTLFPETSDAPGVSAFLRGQEALPACCRTSSVENLSLMPAGRDKAANPAELLSSGRFKDLLRQAEENYERVVIDTAPVNAVSDTLLFASLAAVVCLVIRAGRTPRRAVMRAAQMLARANAKPTGIVLNRLRPGGGANYYYYSEGNYSSPGVYGT